MYGVKRSKTHVNPTSVPLKETEVLKTSTYIPFYRSLAGVWSTSTGVPKLQLPEVEPFKISQSFFDTSSFPSITLRAITSLQLMILMALSTMDQ
jgi:hypothetical protein